MEFGTYHSPTSSPPPNGSTSNSASPLRYIPTTNPFQSTRNDDNSRNNGDGLMQALMQLSEVISTESVDQLIFSLSLFVQGQISKQEYHSRVALVVPESATFLYNRFVRASIFENYRDINKKYEPDDSDDDSSDDSSGDDNQDHLNTPKKRRRLTRVRNEWSPQEDRLFLEGLQRYALNFKEISKIIPNRSQSQIRTHYRYLAKSLKDNNSTTADSEAPKRRIKMRGRPPAGKSNSMPSTLMLELKEVIEAIESSNDHKFGIIEFRNK